MRQRIFNIVVIIAMVASMCVVTALPALAIDYSVKNLQVVVTPNKANMPATIDVSFTTTKSLSSSGLIYIQLPDECNLPESIAPGNIKVNDSSCSSVTITDHTLTIDPAVYIGAGIDVEVQILEAAGILTPYLSQERNDVYPNVSNLHPGIYLLDSFAHLHGDTAQVPDALYKIKVWTSADILPAFGSNFEIFDWIEIDKYDFGKGDIVNVTGAGFTPGDTFTLNVETNQPLIGNCTVQPDGTINIAAQVAQKIPLIPLNGTDESGRASNILWPKCSMMTDAVWMVSFSSVYPLMGNPTMTTWIKPEGVWHLIPSVDIPAPVLPGSVMKIFGFDWGEVNDITISGPVTDPVTMPNLEELDTDCYCMPASFIMPGEFVPMADLQLYIGGKLEIVSGSPVMRSCSEIAEPVDGPGCADDFLVERPVPRTITPGIYQVTVEGVDQMNEQHVVAGGEVMGGPVPPSESYPNMNYIRCFLELLFGDPATAQTIIDAMNNSCCTIEYGAGTYPCGSPCELNPHACVDCEVTVIAEFEVPAPSLVVNPATICKGGTVSLAGAGFVPGEDFGQAVIASGSPQEIASGITVDGQGNFLSQNVMIPPGIDPGTHTITVTFDLEGQEILASATVGVIDCGGCSLTTSSTEGGSVITPGEDTYLYSCGTVVAIVAEASPNYEFTGWTGDTATIANAGSPNTTITVDDHYSIIAEFELSGTATCSLTVSSGTCGQIAAPGVGIFDYTCGTNVPIEVEYSQPCNCCEFTGWEGDIATVNDPGSMSTSILVDGNYTIEAVFDFEWCEWAYDDNADCAIDYPEMIDALMDYLTDKITFGQMIDVLMAYLTS